MSVDRMLSRMDGLAQVIASELFAINAEDDRCPLVPPTAVPWIAERIAGVIPPPPADRDRGQS